jgi:hypothetical protein
VTKPIVVIQNIIFGVRHRSYPITTQNKVEYRAQDVEFEFSCVDGRRQRIYVPDNED